MSDCDDYVYEEEDYEYPADESDVKHVSSLAASVCIPDGNFSILGYKDIALLMTSMIKEVGSLLGVSDDVALILLSGHDWNKEKLLDRYWNDMGKCLSSAGISSLSGTTAATAVSDKLFTCSVCYDTEVPPSETVSLACHHPFCRTCYSNYLRIKVESEGSVCVKTRCPAPKCTERVPDSLFKELLDDETFSRYRDFSIRNFIETSNFLRYCPAACCDRVALGRGITNVMCACGNPFCFRCGEEAHDPASCSQLSSWIAKCKDESETANWMVVNTKKCPKCDSRTEKNQGCNHMTCRMCKHEYCWICMGAWKDHGQDTGGYYSCNKFSEKDKNRDADSSAATSASRELERYLHYYTRYHGHDVSMKHAKRVQLINIENRIKEAGEAGVAVWTDWQYLKEAVLLVIECRRVLKYTYVMGYFLGSVAARRELFEDYQAMLEKNTDTLSEYTERTTDFNKTDVINFTGITKQFMNNLLAAMIDSRFAEDEDHPRDEPSSSLKSDSITAEVSDEPVSKAKSSQRRKRQKMV